MAVETLPPRLPWSGSTFRWRRSFPGQSAELRLRAPLAGRACCLLVPAREDVLSIAVELATNAVRHTATGLGRAVHRGGELARLLRAPCGFRVADDGAPHGPRWPNGPCPAGESGMGLYLVCALASRTGECGDACGRQVWAEVPWQAGPAATGL